jgi:hypothetical protein
MPYMNERTYLLLISVPLLLPTRPRLQVQLGLALFTSVDRYPKAMEMMMIRLVMPKSWRALSPTLVLIIWRKPFNVSV